MATYTNYQQRQLDIKSGEELDRRTSRKQKIADWAGWLSRDVKRFLVDFDSSLEYQNDADPFVRCHPNWVCSEDDLNKDGKAMRAYLLANPEVVNQ